MNGCGMADRAFPGACAALCMGFAVMAADPAGIAPATEATVAARKASSINTMIPCKIFILNHPLFADYKKDY
jgi:hypothetical protein